MEAVRSSLASTISDELATETRLAGEELDVERLIILLPRLLRGNCWRKIDPLIEFHKVGFNSVPVHLKPSPAEIWQEIINQSQRSLPSHSLACECKVFN